MAAPICWRSPFGLAKRLKISPASSIRIHPICQRAGMANLADSADDTQPKPSRSTIVTPAEERKLAEERRKAERLELEKLPEHLRDVDPKTRDVIMNMRLPRSVQAIYLRPLRRTPTHGIPSCDLQLRSYSVRNLEFFADFAMRAAYYLNLAAKGPVPLPRITERWTVPRSNFVHKKSQENFERVTLRRLIQIQDGHPTVVQCWLGYLERKAYHGIGMKANVWDFEGLDVVERMDEQADKLDKEMDKHWSNFGMRADAATEERMEKLLGAKAFSQQIRPMEELIRDPIEINRS